MKIIRPTKNVLSIDEQKEIEIYTLLDKIASDYWQPKEHSTFYLSPQDTSSIRYKTLKKHLLMLKSLCKNAATLNKDKDINDILLDLLNDLEILLSHNYLSALAELHEIDKKIESLTSMYGSIESSRIVKSLTSKHRVLKRLDTDCFYTYRLSMDKSPSYTKHIWYGGDKHIISSACEDYKKEVEKFKEEGQKNPIKQDAEILLKEAEGKRPAINKLSQLLPKACLLATFLPEGFYATRSESYLSFTPRSY